MHTPNYKDMSPEARYNALCDMAPVIYGASWKGKLADQFDLAATTITKWGEKGAPTYICLAMYWALEAQKLSDLRAIISPSAA